MCNKKKKIIIFVNPPPWSKIECTPLGIHKNTIEEGYVKIYNYFCNYIYTQLQDKNMKANAWELYKNVFSLILFVPYNVIICTQYTYDRK
jgi:hypothetical protein